MIPKITVRIVKNKRRSSGEDDRVRRTNAALLVQGAVALTILAFTAGAVLGGTSILYIPLVGIVLASAVTIWTYLRFRWIRQAQAKEQESNSYAPNAQGSMDMSDGGSVADTEATDQQESTLHSSQPSSASEMADNAKRRPHGAVRSRSDAPAPPLIGSAVGTLSAHRGQLGPAWIYAASAAGKTHVAQGGTREDAYALSCPNGDVGSAAVADGVGSARDAHAASLIAVRAAASMMSNWLTTLQGPSWEKQCTVMVDSLNDWLTNNDYIRWVSDALAYVPSQQATRDKTGKPATTLAAAAVRAEGDELSVWWLAYGDAAVLKLANGCWEWLSGIPDQLAESTPALPGSVKHLRQEKIGLHDGELLILATDGFAEAIEAHPDALGNALMQAMKEQVSAAKFCTLLDFDIPGLYDDRTVVVLFKR